MRGGGLLLCAAALAAAPASALRARLQESADASRGSPGGYYWPSGHGRNGDYGNSPYVGPKDLKSSFAWSWHHPGGRFHTLPYGSAIDDKKNIYLTTDSSIWKISENGTAIWSFYPKPKGTIFSAGSLLDGRIHFTTTDCRVFAVSMETGEEIWSNKACKNINHDNSFTAAYDGVVIAALGAEKRATRGGQNVANENVSAFSAVDGRLLWTYKPPQALWNFMGLFPGDGTVVYQDWEGAAYRHRLSDGKLLWRAEGTPGSWTDGTPTLANGVLYTVSATMDKPATPGTLRSHRLSDGGLLWEAPVPLPPNNAPAVGRLPGHTGLSVIQPGGWQGFKSGPTGIFAYDADTGKMQWYFSGPPQKNERQAGEVEGYGERLMAGVSMGYVTNPWSAATVDSDGTVYAGHEDGLFFALRDVNGDGEVKGEAEVSTFDTGAAFVGSSSPAHAPGLMVVASCDSLFAFRSPA